MKQNGSSISSAHHYQKDGLAKVATGASIVLLMYVPM
tara:strand:+ start:421 stop:531 length:111 start_codon:yes stop_codon:yes gene_type:complete